LTKPTNLLEYPTKGANAEEVPGHVQIGTRMLGRAEADGTESGTAPGGEPGGEPGAVRQPGADGTLLAVVPIPGTGTSLAIVGYPVTAPESVAVATGAVPMGPIPAGPISVGAAAGQPAGGRSGLLLDHDQRRVWADGAEVTLTFQEFQLLAFLAAHPTTVFSRAELVRKVWQRDFAADSRTVDVHVSRLRHKLGPSYGRCLVTEYRVGYQFRPTT
jgi:Transcriptional regulatory protein, C terminal